MTHEIKSWCEVFKHRWGGNKPWEIRLNDRKYAPGDFLHEREWDPIGKRFTGRSILSRIPLVYDGKYVTNQPGRAA